VRGGLENFLEASDPDAPVLNSIVDGYRSAPIKIGSDNPDNLYQSANIISSRTYRISGTRGTVKYLGFGTQSGVYGQPGGLSTVDYLDASQLIMQQDGESFEIILATQRPKDYCNPDQSPTTDECVRGNWLRTLRNPDRGLFILRQTFVDRQGETPVNVVIEVIESEPDVAITARSAKVIRTLPREITPAKLEEALTTTGTFVAAVPLLFNNWVAGFQKATNQLPLFDQEVSNKMGGDPNM
jgi:hypothetical protein